MIRGWHQKGEFVRIQVLELLFVKGWANKDVAAFLHVSEQQVANYRFAAVKKLDRDHDARGPADRRVSRATKDRCGLIVPHDASLGKR